MALAMLTMTKMIANDFDENGEMIEKSIAGRCKYQSEMNFIV